MGNAGIDSRERGPREDEALRPLAIGLAIVCVAAQVAGLVAAFFIVPRFERIFEEVGTMPLPAITGFAMSYGLSATFVTIALAVLGTAIWGRGPLRIAALLAAIFLPVLHVLLLVLALFLPLLRIVETLGSGS